MHPTTGSGLEAARKLSLRGLSGGPAEDGSEEVEEDLEDKPQVLMLLTPPTLTYLSTHPLFAVFCFLYDHLPES